MNSVETAHRSFDWPADSERLDAVSLTSDVHASESGSDGFVQLQQFQSSEVCIESHVDVLASTKGYGRSHVTPELEVFINDDIRSLDDGCSMNEASILPTFQGSQAAYDTSRRQSWPLAAPTWPSTSKQCDHWDAGRWTDAITNAISGTYAVASVPGATECRAFR